MARNSIDLTNRKIGLLTVLSRNISEEERRKSKSKLWLCRCDCGNMITLSQNVLLTESSLVRSCGCSKKINPNYHSGGLQSAEEIQSWNDLYEYVKKNVLFYTDDQALSKQMVLRLKGLAKGKYVANNKSADYASYSYKIILLTFKYCSLDLRKAFANKQFEDEKHKFNYACAVVENNINTVVHRLEEAKRMEQKTLTDDLSVALHKAAPYKRVTEEPPPGCEDLW